MGILGSAALLSAACVLPPASAGDDDDGVASGTTGDTKGGSGETTGVPPGMTSFGVTGTDSEGGAQTDPGYESEGSDTAGTTGTTGEPACSGLGPAGLPGANPGVIWIPTNNFAEGGTVSKIDTTTMVETARYVTHEVAESANPLTVSVSLSGDLAVADQGPGWVHPFGAGLTKFHGDTDDCVDVDGNGVITTSMGPVALPWDEEECRAWFLPLDYEKQYGVAWVPGVLDEESCEYEHEKIWTLGMRPDSTAEAVLVDGDSGVIVSSAELPGFPIQSAGQYLDGAVDAEGSLWTTWTHPDPLLLRVDRRTMGVQVWPVPVSVRALTVGPSGYVFTCGVNVGRFDPTTETWDTAPSVGDGGAGCIEDGQGRLWVTGVSGTDGVVAAIDVETLAILDSFVIGNSTPFGLGLGIDFDDHLWVIEWDEAHRIELGTGVQQLYPDLPHARMFSVDYTGFALANLVAP